MSDFLNLHQDAEGLVLRYLQDPRSDLKDLIMVQYAGTVERIARRFSGLEPYEDLVQVGYIGLLNALTKFDPQAGVRFNTYATYLVAGEIKHFLRDRSQTIRHPAWLQELRHKVSRATSVLQQQHGRAPSERELAEHVGVSESSIREVFQTQDLLRVGSLDAVMQGDDDTSEVEKLDAAAFCPEQLSVEDRVVLDQAMAQLRDLERQVLQLFHFDSMNQTEIATRLGISCNYVSHILRQSLAKLRKILSAEDEKDRKLKREDSTANYDILDPATGAYTEAYFRTRLEEEVHRASSSGAEVSIVMFEFSGLEAMRKFYGPTSVTDFLADASEFLKLSVRRLDVVARFGETGFGIILPSTGGNVGLVRQRLLNKAAAWMAGRYSATSDVMIRVGLASTLKDGKTAKNLLKSASAHTAPIRSSQVEQKVA